MPIKHNINIERQRKEVSDLYLSAKSAERKFFYGYPSFKDFDQRLTWQI